MKTTVQMTSFESMVRSILDDCTGYSFAKYFDSDEDDYCYKLYDQYGDTDGDPFYDFDDLISYITEDADVNEMVTALQQPV